MAFFIGQIFKTFEEVSSAMEQYEAKTFAKYWKRDARLITSSRIKKTLRPELKYYEVKFCCIFGGQKFRKTGNNIKEIRTFKKEDLCPAFVAFRVSENGKFLEVKAIKRDHNHETTKIEIDHNINVNTVPNIKPQTYAQKRRKALFVTDSLAALMGQSCGTLYTQRLNMLKTLEMLWKEGKEVILKIKNEEDMEDVIASSK
ncbi:hypothetical protein ABEB36_012713 [Hypothenemus hampei]|uniref:ZSWIM3 N-terminal domain-containing protein n=1 Tax=Hypothenemus hampei TaxID=57062 RepID=A0ABD1EC62_HYPHA